MKKHIAIYIIILGFFAFFRLDQAGAPLYTTKLRTSDMVDKYGFLVL